MFGHMHILGAPGAGKTSLLASLIVDLLNQSAPPAIVFVDHKRIFIEQLSKLALFDGRPPIILSPRHQPALNIFDLGSRGSPAQATKILKYLFSVFRTEMTGKQTTLFDFIIPAMFAFPKALGRNATIEDVFRILDKNHGADLQKVIRSSPIGGRPRSPLG